MPSSTDETALLAFVKSRRNKGQTIALTNGCFDLIHVGHIRLLEASRAHAENLIVAINSDASTRALKGPGRPIVPQDERAEVLLALRCVDHVHIFDDATMDRLLEVIRPDVYCKGTEYTIDSIPESATVRRLGVDFRCAGDPKTHASTDLIRTIRALPGERAVKPGAPR